MDLSVKSLSSLSGTKANKTKHRLGLQQMATQQTQGIQTLLEAEKEAAKIVQQARQYRTQKLKDARTEAEREIEQYKQAKEAEFKAFEASHAGNTSNIQAGIDRETEIKLRAITTSYDKNKDVVVKKLLDRVVLAQSSLHRNLKKASN